MLNKLDNTKILHYGELNRERILLVNKLRDLTFRRVSRKTRDEIIERINNCQTTTTELLYFEDLVKQDALAWESGFDPSVCHERMQSIITDHAYANDEDYQVIHHMFMGTREGYELSENIAGILFRMSISDEYIDLIKHLHDEATQGDDIEQPTHLFETYSRLMRSREAIEVCLNYNKLVRLRRQRTLKSVEHDKISINYEGLDMIFLPVGMYQQKMDLEGLSCEEMSDQGFFLPNDDEAFCKLSHEKRDSKNICQDDTQIIVEDVRENLIVDLYTPKLSQITQGLFWEPNSMNNKVI